MRLRCFIFAFVLLCFVQCLDMTLFLTVHTINEHKLEVLDLFVRLLQLWRRARRGILLTWQHESGTVGADI